MNTTDKDVARDSLAIFDNGVRLTRGKCGKRSLAIYASGSQNLQRMEAKNPLQR